MRRSRLPAALTLCGLLAFATSASAECGWVLWSGSESKVPWEAFATQKQCESHRDRAVIYDPKDTTPLQCLPETTGPETTCQWVLWRYSVIKVPAPSKTVFETPEECEAARDRANRTLPGTIKTSFRCGRLDVPIEDSPP
jgi:hypothetical protein